MKRVGFLLFLGSCFVPLASAQDGEHVELGVFADYFRLAQTTTISVASAPQPVFKSIRK